MTSCPGMPVPVPRSIPISTVRRACANLLRIRLIDPYKEDKRPPAPPAPLEMPSESNLLESLLRLSEEAEARNREDTPPPGYNAERSGSGDFSKEDFRDDWNRR